MSASLRRSCRWSSGGAAAARSALERTIAAGGVAVFPSDGVYGLACDPLDAGAIARIHRMKGRDDGKPAAVMYFSPLAMRELVAELGPRAAAAVSALLPGPVTLVVEEPRPPLSARLPRGRRAPRRPPPRPARWPGRCARSSRPRPTSAANRRRRRFDDVPDSILAAVDLAIDGGELAGLPSTVVDIAAIDDGGGWEILRQGAISEGDLASALAPSASTSPSRLSSSGDKRRSAARAGERQAHPAVRGVVVLVRLEQEVLRVDRHPEDEAAAQAADVDVLLVVVGGVDVRPADRGAEPVALDAGSWLQPG